MARRRLLALVDGEHYPPVVRAAIDHAGRDDDVVAALLLGGEEKLSGDPDFGVPLERAGDDRAADMVAAAGRHRADAVLDLSDEPVLSPPGRFWLVTRALAAGLAYVGPDFTFVPPERTAVGAPSLAIIGTGKRIGKTAVSGYAARLLDEDRRRDGSPIGGEVVVVAMGRGGPPEPDVVEAGGIDVGELLRRARGGAHAASDYLEDAALARVTTVGCRRCGGGLAGAPYLSNVVEGVRLAERRKPGIVLVEGSGAALPPVASDRTVLVMSATMPPEHLTVAVGPYRPLRADLLVLTMCEPPLADRDRVDALRRAVAELRPDLPVVATVFRPGPAERVRGERVALFTTAPEAVHGRIAEALADEHGADVVAVSGNLSKRDRLRADLDSDDVRSADTFVTEIKAAAIDVVADAAEQRGARLVFCDNVPEPVDGGDLDGELLRLAHEAVAGHA